MEYLIYRKNIPSQYIDLELTLQCAENETIVLQLPAWRPGRYELANYAQKLRHLKVVKNNTETDLIKIKKDRWKFTAPHCGLYRIQYQYHASQMDAGGSWSDDEQLYINFINLAFQVIGREREEVFIRLNLPVDYKLATALPSPEPFVLAASGFQHLVDSPLIASSSLQQEKYTIGGATFHLWFQGAIHFDLDQLKTNFINFTKKQIEAFGEFPAVDYHFIYQLLPYAHYHGVEHQFSTVITLGPAQDLGKKAHLDRLLGVSSHELYHFWNVCRIRPKELLPYDFSKEAYIDTGVVAEGVTTYMGDLFLCKSGYFSVEEYFKLLEKLINREFEQFGWRNQSIVASSLDLWLDGYKPGIPDRKVSIYNRGALIALCLDLMLLDRKSSLSQVMQIMWMTFGQTEIGYQLEDFQSIISREYNDLDAIEDFFKRFIYGKEDLLPYIESQLETVGIALNIQKREGLEGDYGLLLDETSRIISIHPDSPAYSSVMAGDTITESNIEKDSLSLTVQRNHRALAFNLPRTAESYYKTYQLLQRGSNEKINRWLNQVQ